MIKETISRAFNARNVAHLEHWKTKSFSQHTALNDFYDSIIDQIDLLVEVYQGNFDIIKNITLKQNDKDILSLIEEDLVWLEDNYCEITQGVSSLENILDGLMEIYLKTRYKLKHLQ